MLEQHAQRQRNQSQGNINLNSDHNHGSNRERLETSGSKNNASTTATTTTSDSNINDSHLHYLDACKIWFNPDGARAANELKQLPLDEREKVWADLTGREATTTFTQNIVEDPSMLKGKLHELKQAIIKNTTMTGTSTNALKLVLTSHPDYVYDATFLLKFLRASGYNINESAIRMNQHFEMKRELFGDEKLGRDILLEDLEEEADCSSLSSSSDVGVFVDLEANRRSSDGVLVDIGVIGVIVDMTDGALVDLEDN